MNRRPLRFVALAYAAAVLWVTVGPAPWRTRSNQLEGGILNLDAWTAPVTWTTGYLWEMALNVALFVPVGMLAALMIPRRSWPLALLVGLAFTTVIELVQAIEPTRISDPRDLVMNTGGAAVGVVFVLVARMVRRAGAAASRLAAGPPSVVRADPVDPVALVDRVDAELVGSGALIGARTAAPDRVA